MISTQYQNQPNFQGNLLKSGIKLPQKKFSEVAKIYAEKTTGTPDLMLAGRLENGYKGYFYHATDAVMNGEDVATILTSSLQSMFKNLSPKRIAEELINLTRKVDYADKANVLRREINDTQKRLINVKFKLERTQSPTEAKRLQTLIDRMEATIAKKENQYEKIKPNEISGEWSI